MVDLLAHALFAYAGFTLAGRHWNWLTPQYVTAGMAGACIPDLVKIKLLVPAEFVEAVLGVHWSWDPLLTGGGAALAVLVGTVLAGGGHRRRVASVLGVGAVSHLLLDAILKSPSGVSYAMFWPLTRHHPPTPGLTLSTSPWPTVIAGSFALGVWAWTRRAGARETAASHG